MDGPTLAGVILVAFVVVVPVSGFVNVISNLPEIGRRKDLYIYAFTTFPIADLEFEIGKLSGLPTSAVEAGTLPLEFDHTGCYLKVSEMKRYQSSRYGRYTLRLFHEGLLIPELDGFETFVKRPTKLLDTGGVYTVTVYPAAQGDSALSKYVSIGVRSTPGCKKITWCKGKEDKRISNTGPRLLVKSTKQAGLYTISRPSRGKRWFVQIRVIAADCPEGSVTVEERCVTTGLVCMNGGILADGPACTCPPFYYGLNCGCVYACPPGWENFGENCYNRGDSATDFQEADEACRGMGGHLASIHSAAENEFVRALIEESPANVLYGEGAILGLNDKAVEDKFVYTDGTRVDFSNFDDGGADNELGVDCVEIIQDGLWVHRDCASLPTQGYVCKRPAGDPGLFMLEPTNDLRCGDLPGGNPKCRGHLNCLGYDYGCKCSPGWWGNACDRPCPKGKYGPGCEVRCPDEEPDCNRFFGPSTNFGAFTCNNLL